MDYHCRYKPIPTFSPDKDITDDDIGGIYGTPLFHISDADKLEDGFG